MFFLIENRRKAKGARRKLYELCVTGFVAPLLHVLYIPKPLKRFDRGYKPRPALGQAKGTRHLEPCTFHLLL